MLPQDGVQTTLGAPAEGDGAPEALTPAADGAAITATTIARSTLLTKTFRRVMPLLPLLRFPALDGLTENGPASYPPVIGGLPLAGIVPSMTTHSASVHWSLVSSQTALDPARCLGELYELPASARPGDWCTVVAFDDLGELRWTLLAHEAERTSSLFADRRGGASRSRGWITGGSARAERYREREGTDGAVAPARAGQEARPG
jgi:hypothetical protein